MLYMILDDNYSIVSFTDFCQYCARLHALNWIVVEKNYFVLISLWYIIKMKFGNEKLSYINNWCCNKQFIKQVLEKLIFIIQTSVFFSH